MLNKLLKYDLKSLLKTITPLYMILIMLAVLNRICIFSVSKLPILKVPAGFIMTLYIIMLIGVPIASFIISIIKFYNNLTKDEGYLMHTLPVTKSNLISSKLFSSMIILVTSLAVTFIAFMIGSYSDKISKIISGIFKLIAEADKSSVVILVSIVVILGVILLQLMIYASIALGQKHNTNKGIFSIVYGVILYNVNQIISTLFILIPIMFNPNIKKYMNSDNVPNNIFNQMMISAIILTTILIVGYYFTTIKVMDKKLNLE